MQQFNVKVIVISIANPMLVGIYQNDCLVETIQKEGKTSDILPTLFNDVLSKYNIEEIFYVNGPGSYMAIKIAYVFLKTISLVNQIKLYAISGFDLNGNSPIKALGKKYFIRIESDGKEEIIIDFLNDREIQEFVLPDNLLNLKFSENTLPEYNLPAV